jgi:hypothetical protein
MYRFLFSPSESLMSVPLPPAPFFPARLSLVHAARVCYCFTEVAGSPRWRCEPRRVPDSDSCFAGCCRGLRIVRKLEVASLLCCGSVLGEAIRRTPSLRALAFNYS